MWKMTNNEERSYNADVIFELRHLAFLLWTTSLLPSGSRNCAIQQTGVSIFSMSNETPRSFSFVMLASMSSTSKATVVPSRERFHGGLQPTPIVVGPKSYSTHAPSMAVVVGFNSS